MRYAILSPAWLPAGHITNSAGKLVETFKVEMRRVGALTAPTAEAALAKAKQAGHFCPIIEPIVQQGDLYVIH